MRTAFHAIVVILAGGIMSVAVPRVSAQEESPPGMPEPIPVMDYSVGQLPLPGELPPGYVPPAPPIAPQAWKPPPPPRSLGWLDMDYLLWSIKKEGQPPLLNTGTEATFGLPANGNNPGLAVIGGSGTNILRGNGALDFRQLQGGNFDAGLWFNRANTFGVEAEVFFLPRRDRDFIDFGGAQVLARPVINAATNRESAYFVNFPNAFDGMIFTHNATEMWGGEFDALYVLSRKDGCCFTLLGGFRHVNLEEYLAIAQRSTLEGNGIAAFNGQTILPPLGVGVFDHFNTENDFNGFNLGAKLELTSGRFFAEFEGKVAAGSNAQNVLIQGQSTEFNGNGTVAGQIPGGLLALSSNMGNHTRSVFSVVPEGGITVGFHFSPFLQATFGYNFLYWTNVVRPGEQIDRHINSNLLPTSRSFGTAGGPNVPAFNFHEENFYAQGINLGIRLSF